QTYIYDPYGTNTWTFAANKLRNDRNNEETWNLLPDNSILAYEVFTESGGTGRAQRYVPSSNTWVDAGVVPVALSGGTAFGFEMGGQVLLQATRVGALGANGNAAFYDPTTNSWAAGPTIPRDSLNRVQGADDAPAAVLPNGKVLLAVDRPLFNSP